MIADGYRDVAATVIIFAGLISLWFGVEEWYRSTHCILLFGHWFDVSGSSTPVVFGHPLFCQ